MSNFIKNNSLQNNNIFLTDYKNNLNFLNLKKIILAIYAKEILQKYKLSQNKINEIINNCINFYIELCDQILKRFEFQNKFKSLASINPHYIINGTGE